MQLTELGLAACGFDGPGVFGKPVELGNLLTHLFGVAGERDGLQHALKTFALSVFEFFQLSPGREAPAARCVVPIPAARLRPSSSRLARFSSERRMA